MKTMIAVREVGKAAIYVAFPPAAGGYGEYRIFDDMHKWLIENTKPEWGYINGKVAGVFLEKEDAVAFKLKWI